MFFQPISYIGKIFFQLCAYLQCRPREIMSQFRQLIHGLIWYIFVVFLVTGILPETQWNILLFKWNAKIMTVYNIWVGRCHIYLFWQQIYIYLVCVFLASLADTGVPFDLVLVLLFPPPLFPAFVSFSPLPFRPPLGAFLFFLAWMASTAR